MSNSEKGHWAPAIDHDKVQLDRKIRFLQEHIQVINKRLVRLENTGIKPGDKVGNTR